MTRMTSAIAVATALLTTGAVAAMEFDTNDDGQVDAREFLEGDVAASTFDRFDDNDDSVLIPEELGLSEPNAAFLQADANNDGRLNEREVGLDVFGYYDTNFDSMLNPREMSEYDDDVELGREVFPDHAPRTGAEVNQ